MTEMVSKTENKGRRRGENGRGDGENRGGNGDGTVWKTHEERVQNNEKRRSKK